VISGLREKVIHVLFVALIAWFFAIVLSFNLSCDQNSLVIEARDTNLVVVLVGTFVFQVIKKRKLTRSEGPFERG
jgi:phosphoglycerol transferase MdoB-like AlkP superfamily enzyme